MKSDNFLKLILITFLTAVFSIQLFAQDDGTSQQENRGRGFFLFGWSYLNLDKLNSELAIKGYPKFSNNFISFGGFGYGIKGKLLLGGHGNALVNKGVTNGIYKMNLNAAYGFFDLGYLVYSLNDLNMYPLIGIGGGGLNLKIYENKVLTFDEILNNPKRGVDITTGGFLLNFGFGIDYLIHLGKEENNKGGVAIGIRAGYILNPIIGGWKMEDLDISGGPELGITGPYIQIMIGGGGSDK